MWFTIQWSSLDLTIQDIRISNALHISTLESRYQCFVNLNNSIDFFIRSDN